MPTRLPPFPPETAHTPVMLSWRLDAHQDVLSEHAERIKALESKPLLPEVPPVLGRAVMALVLLMLGSWLHLPLAEKVAMKLLGN